MSHHDDDDGPRCICGQVVAVPHGECMALLTRTQRRAFDKGRPIPQEDFS